MSVLENVQPGTQVACQCRCFVGNRLPHPRSVEHLRARKKQIPSGPLTTVEKKPNGKSQLKNHNPMQI